MVTIRRIAGSEITAVHERDLQAALSARDSVIWVHATGRSPAEHDLLCGLGLDPLVVEDLLDDAVHPKAEAHPDYLFAVVHGIDVEETTAGDAFELATLELDGVVGRGWLVTHADRPLAVVDAIEQVVDFGAERATTPAQLLHLLLDRIVDEYEPFIDDFIPQRIDDIEDALFADNPSREVRREIYLRRRDVIRLQRVAGPQAAAVRKLARLAESGDVAVQDAHLFHDIADRLDRVASVTGSLRDQLDSAFEHYHSAVATGQNEVMKLLTMVSSVLLPITVVTGVYGMNFVYMPELDERWAYPAVLGLNALILVTGLSLFRARGWIGRRRPRTAGADRLELPSAGAVLRVPAMGARFVGRKAAGLAWWRTRR